MAEISVIMLVHNREDYVGKAVQSILSQSFKDFELIIVNNCSTDGSMKIVKEYQKKDSRVWTFDSTTENIGAGRNLGLSKATGKYFTFVDDDDYCMPDFLKTLYQLAEEYNADLSVCGSYYDIEGEIKPKYVYDELLIFNKIEAMTDFLLRKHFNNGNPTKLFRRTTEICKVNYNESGKYDDIHTMYRFFMALGNKESAVVAKGKPMYCFRRHCLNNSNATLDFQRLSPEWLKEYACAYNERTVYIGQKMPELTALARYTEWSWMISMVEKIHRFSLENCREQLEYMENVLRKNKEEFYRSKWIRDFEREWIKKYI